MARCSESFSASLLQMLDRTRFDSRPRRVSASGPGVGVRYPDVVVDRASPRLAGPGLRGADFHRRGAFAVNRRDSTSPTSSQEYTAIASVQTYLICSQDEPRAWVWARQGDGSWPKLPLELAGREGSIALGGLGIELAMAAIFRGIPDAPTLD